MGRSWWLIALPAIAGACLLPDYRAGSTGTAGGSGGEGATGGGSGAAGGSGGEGGQIVCPNQFTTVLGNDSGEVHVLSAHVLPSAGQTVVMGRFTTEFNFVPGIPTTYDSGRENYFLGSLDQDGSGQWIHTIRGDGSQLTVGSVIPVADGVIVTFSNDDDIYIDNQPGIEIDLVDERDGFAMKLEADGDIAWTKHLAGAGAALFHSAVVAPGGELVLVGQYQDESVLDGIVFPASGAGQMPFLVRLDPTSGAVIARSLQAFPADLASIKDAVFRGEVLYLLGEYSGSFPQFGLTTPPTTAPQYDLFVVEIGSDGIASMGVAFGHPERSDGAHRILDSGRGLVVYGGSNGGTVTATPYNFVGVNTNAQMPDANAATFVGEMAYDGTGQWFALHRLINCPTIGAGFSAGSMIRHGDGFVVGHVHVPLGSPTGTLVGGDPHLTPEVDSLWIHHGPAGEIDGRRLFGEPDDSNVVRFALSTSVCGDLVHGRFIGDIEWPGQPPAATSFRGLVSFQTEPVTFDP